MNKQELIKEIGRLRKEKEAIILAHNYQRPEVQDVADFAGDSLDLAKKGVSSKAKVIVFCGVSFMAESANILSPEKTVLLPMIEAGCPLADMVTVEALRAKRKEHPKAAVVCYVNSPAQVKAESDVCCTSSNAIKVVNSLKEEEVIFIPDRQLGRYVAEHTKKKIHLWPGFCAIHYSVTPEEIIEAKEKYPGAEVLVHPECRLEVIALADAALSTNGMIEYARKSKSREFIIGTEMGLLHRLKKEMPDKEFHLASKKFICPNMKLTTLKRVAESLREMKHIIKIPKDIREKAKRSLERMVEIS